MNYELRPIATIRTDFPTKFGVPRQSGLVKGLKGKIVFEPEYCDPEALRGLDGFSHIWLLWDFSEARASNSKFINSKFKATVRPPRLGGNKRVGVFATRSPFRPNNIGLSSVRILNIDLHTPDGPVIEVEGADMMDGTPIFDIKPYLAFTDCHPDAKGSLTPDPSPEREGRIIKCSSDLMAAFDAEHLEALKEILLSDPRPHYHDDAERIYGLPFAGKEVKFRINGNEIEAWA
jgi:tRNA-Thr(GGU) m(6)t(6)A37 methyltransferase TsaA